MLSSPSALKDLAFPAASISAREIAKFELSTALSAAAYDTAFDEYVSRRLLLAATSGSSADSKFEKSILQPDSTDADEPCDLIQLDELSLVESDSLADDQLSRERAAVDEVLRSLHDMDNETYKTTIRAHGTRGEGVEAVLRARIGLSHPAGEPDELPSIEVLEVGMVLLQATGDANDSPYDLAAIEKGSFDLPAIRWASELSIGVQQAFDVSADDLPARVADPATRLVPPSADEARTDSPQKTEPSSRQQAATVFGISTLLGAILPGQIRRRRSRSQT
jgi:hypothetical protein